MRRSGPKSNRAITEERNPVRKLFLDSGRMIFSAARCRIVSERLMSPYSQCRGVPLPGNIDASKPGEPNEYQIAAVTSPLGTGLVE